MITSSNSKGVEMKDPFGAMLTYDDKDDLTITSSVSEANYTFNSDYDRVQLAMHLLRGTDWVLTTHKALKDAHASSALMDAVKAAGFVPKAHVAEEPYDNKPPTFPKQDDGTKTTLADLGFETWGEVLADFLNREYNKDGHLFHADKPGKKYQRVVKGVGVNISAHAFVDAEANVYKIAGWSTPAKGVRTTVHDILDGKKATDPNGGYLYR